MRKRNGRRGRGGDPRRLQLCGDEVRRERNLHRRVSKKRGFIGASAPSFFIRNVRPADSCYIRLTRLLGQVVSQGLQFLHNRRRRAADRQRRRRRRQGGRAGNPVENVAPGWSARSRPRLTTSSAMVPPPARTCFRPRALVTTDGTRLRPCALATTDAPIHTPSLPARAACIAPPSTRTHPRCTTVPAAPPSTRPSAPHHRPTTAGSHHPRYAATDARYPRQSPPASVHHPRLRCRPHRNRAKSSILPASPPSSDQNARFSAIPFLPI